MAKRYKEKHIKMPFCVKILDASLKEQFHKVIEEFEELGTENANLLNKADRKEHISADDIKRAFLEAFDVSQAAQSYMRLLILIFGKHYCLTFDDLFDKAIYKNKKRKYYEEAPPFDILDWGDDK